VTVGDLADYCVSKPGAEEAYPCGGQDLAAKVGGSKAFVHSPNLRESTRVRETCL
jgi:predicted DNA-binding protein (MmcQ/YjbR family)